MALGPIRLEQDQTTAQLQVQKVRAVCVGLPGGAGRRRGGGLWAVGGRAGAGAVSQGSGALEGLLVFVQLSPELRERCNVCPW